MDTAAVSTVSEALPSRRLQGKVAIITGAGGSIGVETAERFLRGGASVSLIDLSKDALSSALIRLNQRLSPEIHVDSHTLSIQADVTVDSEVAKYTDETIQKFGRLDCVFLNAGISYNSTSIFDTTEDNYEKVMRVNVKSAFLGLKHAATSMRDLGNGGSIILTSSIAGLRGTPGLILYSSSKFALRGLCLTAAAELGEFGIRVNTIHPSGVNTPMFRQAWSPEKIEELKKGIPLGRFAEVSDVAGVVAFLASDDSKFMTGGFLKIDGGCVSF